VPAENYTAEVVEFTEESGAAVADFNFMEWVNFRSIPTLS